MSKLIETDYDEEQGGLCGNRPYYVKLSYYWFSRIELMRIKDEIEKFLKEHDK